jgi:hypothetical protein
MELMEEKGKELVPLPQVHVFPGYYRRATIANYGIFVEEIVCLVLPGHVLLDACDAWLSSFRRCRSWL